MSRIQNIVAQYRETVARNALPLDLWVQPLPSKNLPQLAELHPAFGDHDPSFRTAFVASPRTLGNLPGLFSTLFLRVLGGASPWLKWTAIGTAATATAGGLVVYNVAGDADNRKPEVARGSASEVANDEQIGSVFRQCMGFTRNNKFGDSSDEHWELMLSTPGSTADRIFVRFLTVFQFLKGQGIGCPGHHDFGNGVPGAGACVTLFEFGVILNARQTGKKTGTIAEMVKVLAKRPTTYGPASLLESERAAILRNLQNFDKTLTEYFQRICASGALQASPSAPATP